MKQSEKKCLLCDSQAFSRNLCKNCYMQKRRLGTLAKYKPVVTRVSIETRVKKTRTCWLWTGDHSVYGYGVVSSGRGKSRKRTQAHRYVYRLLVGPIPKGKILMHICDNPPCVNPAHLRVGTIADNQRDMVSKERNPCSLNHWNGRLSDKQVAEIRRSTLTQSALARRYKVDPSHISRIKSGESRTRHLRPQPVKYEHQQDAEQKKFD